MVQLNNGCGIRLRARGLTAIGAIAVGAGLMLSGSGVAWADNHTEKADPSMPAAEPVAKDGIRTSAVQGDLRADGDQGIIRESEKAVPEIKTRTQIDNPMNDDWQCLESWGGRC